MRKLKLLRFNQKRYVISGIIYAQVGSFITENIGCMGKVLLQGGQMRLWKVAQNVAQFFVMINT
jgi:hypothetical protein